MTIRLEPDYNFSTTQVESNVTHSGDDISRVLKSTFGFTSFLPNQEQIIRAVLAGRDVFAALPTGGGKSLCYQLPALLMPGTAVVISPLIALMKDQVDAARELGIEAEFLNSSLTLEEFREVNEKIDSGQVKLLYVSPERLALEEAPIVPVLFITSQVVFQKGIKEINLPALGTPYMSLRTISLSE